MTNTNTIRLLDKISAAVLELYNIALGLLLGVFGGTALIGILGVLGGSSVADGNAFFAFIGALGAFGVGLLLLPVIGSAYVGYLLATGKIQPKKQVSYVTVFLISSTFLATLPTLILMIIPLYALLRHYKIIKTTGN